LRYHVAATTARACTKGTALGALVAVCPVKHEWGWDDVQVRSGQAIQREPPVSAPPSSRPADTRSWPVRLRTSRQPAAPNSPAWP